MINDRSSRAFTVDTASVLPSHCQGKEAQEALDGAVKELDPR